MQSAIDPRDSKFHIKAHYAGSISRCVYHGEDESVAVATMQRYCDNKNVSVVDLWAGGRLRYTYIRHSNKLIKR